MIPRPHTGERRSDGAEEKCVRLGPGTSLSPGASATLPPCSSGGASRWSARGRDA